MKTLSNFAKNFYNLTCCLEDYDLFQVWRNGGIPSLYKELNEPWFRDLNISTVLDIGANIGQSTLTLNKILPNAQMYAFEPIPECFNKLSERFLNSKNIQPINLGLGAEAGEIIFEKNSYSPSSSLLKMTDIHKKSFPFTEKSEKITVKIERLDDVAKNLNLSKSMMAKIDVQGYEDKVIAGGCETLRKCQLVIIETSFETLYQEQPLFQDIYSLMINMGFRYAGSMGQLLDPQTQRCLQSDSLFLKQN